MTDPPPQGRPVTTEPWGVVVFEAPEEGDFVKVEAVPALYTHVTGPEAMEGGWTWVRWRQPTWRELASLRPASPDPGGARRGWWPPTAPELEARRETLRRIHRTRAKREQKGGPEPRVALNA